MTELFPGKWTGYFLDDRVKRNDEKWPLEIDLKVVQSKHFSGFGKDDVGAFTLTNICNKDNQCQFVKVYSTHTVTYTGSVGPDGTSMSGHWFLTTSPQTKGNFVLTRQASKGIGNQLDTQANSIGGKWVGHFLDDRCLGSDRTWPLEVCFTINNQTQYTGSGKDEIGPFTLTDFKLADSQCQFVKVYSKHTVTYTGSVGPDGISMSGHWFLTTSPQTKGNFVLTQETHLNRQLVCQGSFLYTDVCSRFKDTLGIHDEYFDGKFDLCYCTTCHKLRCDKSLYHRGEPEAAYAVPVGWCRFGLKTPPKIHQVDGFNKWHRGYHGTKVNKIVKILNVGDIVPAGVKTLGGSKVREREGHFCDDWKPTGFNTKQVFVSPSIVYAGCEAYATSTQFTDPEINASFNAQVALQILISPDSYNTGPQTIGASTQIDPLFENNNLEWFTDQHGAVIIYGLLVKLSRQ